MLRRRFLVWSPRGTRSGSINPRAISSMLSIHSNTEKSQGIYAMTSETFSRNCQARIVLMFILLLNRPYHPIEQSHVFFPCSTSCLCLTYRYFISDLQQTNQTHVLSWAESSKGPANALQWTIICKSKLPVV